MAPESLALSMLGVMILLTMLGGHIAFVMGGLAVIFGYIGGGAGTLSMFPHRLYTVCTNFPLEAVVLFILMGVVFERSGIAEKLYDALYILMGPLRGGLLLSSILMATLMAACTGISGAAVVSEGLIALPTMLKHKYDKSLATGTICTAGGLGVIIPPSVMLILYGPVAGLSVSDLFLGAIFPGLILSALYVAYVMLFCLFKPSAGPALPKEERSKYTLSMKFKLAMTSLLPTFSLIFAVLGSILFGVASPTEAGSVGVVGAFVLCAAYGKLTIENIKRICWFTIKTSTFILAIVAGAALFTSVFLSLNGGELLSRWVLSLELGKHGVVLVMVMLIFILGMFMDWIGILLIVVPIFIPIIKQLGMDPLWFGIVFAITLQISYITPPFAYSVFFLKGIAPKEVGIYDIYKGVVPFIPLQFIALVIIYCFPYVVTWVNR